MDLEGTGVDVSFLLPHTRASPNGPLDFTNNQEVLLKSLRRIYNGRVCFLIEPSRDSECTAAEDIFQYFLLLPLQEVRIILYHASG